MKYFVMSRHFNKSYPEDFGLIRKDGKIVSSLDNSIWESKKLYDFGWGKENGFYKIPLPTFNELINIILEEKDEDDIYGAAAVILDAYSSELLIYLETIQIQDEFLKNRLNRLFLLFNPINRTLKPHMSLEEIEKEHQRWKSIAEKFQ